MNDKFQKAKQNALDKVYDKQTGTMIKQLQKEYQRAYKEIKVEINEWLEKIEKGAIKTPDFRYSRLHQLEDLEKQIRLILEELAEIEVKIVEEGIKTTYVSDYIDLQKINNKYLDMSLNTSLPEFNSLNSAQFLEAFINAPSLAKTTTLEIAKQINLDWFYDGTAGRWFDARIYERHNKFGYTLKETIRKEMIKGNTLNQMSTQIARDFDTTFKHAKTLIRTEVATAENIATVHNAQKLGYNALKFSCMNRETTCEVCKSMNGKIFLVTEINGNELVMHPNCRCVLQETTVDENGKEINKVDLDDALAFRRERANKRDEENRKIKEDFLRKKKQTIKQSKPRL